MFSNQGVSQLSVLLPHVQSVRPHFAPAPVFEEPAVARNIHFTQVRGSQLKQPVLVDQLVTKLVRQTHNAKRKKAFLLLRFVVQLSEVLVRVHGLSQGRAPARTRGRNTPLCRTPSNKKLRIRHGPPADKCGPLANARCFRQPYEFDLKTDGIGFGRHVHINSSAEEALRTRALYATCVLVKPPPGKKSTNYTSPCIGRAPEVQRWMRMHYYTLF